MVFLKNTGPLQALVESACNIMSVSIALLFCHIVVSNSVGCVTDLRGTVDGFHSGLRGGLMEDERYNW